MTQSLSLAIRQYSVEPRTRIYVKGYGFLSFARNFSNKYSKQLLNTGKMLPKMQFIKQPREQVNFWEIKLQTQ